MINFLKELEEKTESPAVLQAIKMVQAFNVDTNAREEELKEFEKTESLKQERKKAKVVTLLPEWSRNKRAAMTAIFRSKLFSHTVNCQKRAYVEKEDESVVAGYKILFTGKVWDQSDLDVYLELLQFCEEQKTINKATFTSYDLLKRLGLQTEGTNTYKWVDKTITRITAGTVDIVNPSDPDDGFFGHIIEGGEYKKAPNGKGRIYEVTLAEGYVRMFRADWSSLDIEQRRALGRNNTAKSLHAYLSSHRAPGFHKWSTLADICGLAPKQARNAKVSLRKAITKLQEIGFIKDIDEKGDCVKLSIAQSKSQNLAIVKNIITARKRVRSV